MEEPAKLNESYSKNTKWSEYCAIALVIGLFLEVVLPLCEGKEIGFWTQIFPAIIVAIAVLGEIIFGNRARSASDELTRLSNEKIAGSERRVAEANQKAEEARLAHERLKSELAWRYLEHEQKQKIVKSLTESEVRGAITFVYFDNDIESMSFMEQFESVFRAAQWQTSSVRIVAVPNIFGIMLVDTQDETAKLSTLTAQKALESANVSIGITQISRRGWQGNLSSGNPTKECATLFIGQKRMPFMDMAIDIR